MEPVVRWLQRLGLGQYAAAFADADIDREVLRDLGDADLEKLGVTLGHRKKLLRAIAELSPPSVNESQRPSPAATPIAADAERRQLTVMFCDLVGSTSLSARLDPEDLRAIIGAYHECVGEAVRRFDGFVAKYMGDGVLAYFGCESAPKPDPSPLGVELFDNARTISFGEGSRSATIGTPPVVGIALVNQYFGADSAGVPFGC